MFLEELCGCVIDGTGKIVREGKIASESEALIVWFRSLRWKSLND
jgi:transposase